MSRFLTRLAARTVGEAPALAPRPLAIFEPEPASPDPRPDLRAAPVQRPEGAPHRAGSGSALESESPGPAAPTHRKTERRPVAHPPTPDTGPTEASFPASLEPTPAPVPEVGPPVASVPTAPTRPTNKTPRRNAMSPVQAAPGRDAGATAASKPDAGAGVARRVQARRRSPEVAPARDAAPISPSPAALAQADGPGLHHAASAGSRSELQPAAPTAEARRPGRPDPLWPVPAAPFADEPATVATPAAAAGPTIAGRVSPLAAPERRPSGALAAFSDHPARGAGMHGPLPRQHGTSPPDADEPPVIDIRIGRLEVRAPTPAESAPSPRSGRSLDAFLDGRRG